MCNAVSSMTITLLMVENNNVAIIDILAYFCQFLSDKQKKKTKKKTDYLFPNFSYCKSQLTLVTRRDALASDVDICLSPFPIKRGISPLMPSSSNN